jgi:hypothetical protein
VWELLKTVSLLKSEFTKDKIKPKKLITTKKNCRKVKDIILLSNIPVSLKFLIEKKIIKEEKESPKIKE